MARLTRLFLPGFPLHVIQRGNNRQRVFFEPEDGALYLDWLQQAAALHALAVHAYVLMPNHVHLLATPSTAESLPRTLQALGARYVRHINKRMGRSGTLWEGRYRACLVETERYFMACSRYIELNPVRAGIAREPGAFRWSSYKHNAEGRPDPMVTQHKIYQSLGATPEERCAAYRDMVAQGLADDDLAAIRTATHGGWALGTDGFRAKVLRRTGRPAAPRSPGRPRLKDKERPKPKNRGRR